MSKLSLVLAVAFLLVCGGRGHAIEKTVLQSPILAKARTCLDNLIDAGKKSGSETDRSGGIVLVLNQAQKPLHPVLIGTATCLDAAFPKSEVVERFPNAPRTGSKSRIWYAASDGGFIWCASNSLDNDIKSVDVLAGNGPKKAWFAVTVKCDVGDDILGWYTPKAR
jgi:hypothetical protein